MTIKLVRPASRWLKGLAAVALVGFVFALTYGHPEPPPEIKKSIHAAMLNRWFKRKFPCHHVGCPHWTPAMDATNRAGPQGLELLEFEAEKRRWERTYR